MRTWRVIFFRSNKKYSTQVSPPALEINPTPNQKRISGDLCEIRIELKLGDPSAGF